MLEPKETFSAGLGGRGPDFGGSRGTPIHDSGPDMDKGMKMLRPQKHSKTPLFFDVEG
jgi:hypothetical protein